MPGRSTIYEPPSGSGRVLLPALARAARDPAELEGTSPAFLVDQGSLLEAASRSSICLLSSAGSMICFPISVGVEGGFDVSSIGTERGLTDSDWLVAVVDPLSWLMLDREDSSEEVEDRFGSMLAETGPTAGGVDVKVRVCPTARLTLQLVATVTAFVPLNIDLARECSLPALCCLFPSCSSVAKGEAGA